jgi:hypothetical protein
MPLEVLCTTVWSTSSAVYLISVSVYFLLVQKNSRDTSDVVENSLLLIIISYDFYIYIISLQN